MEHHALFTATLMPDRDWWAALWPDPRAVLETAGIEHALAGLDLCSGDGYFTVPLAAWVGTTVIAVDLDPAMLHAAQHAAASQGVTNIRWIEGDAMEVDRLVDERVDRVLIANTLHGAPDKTALARAVARVLIPGGRFVVINWWPRPRAQTQVLGAPRGPRDELRFAPETVAAWLRPAGFELERVDDVSPYHYAARFRLDAPTAADDPPAR